MCRQVQQSRALFKVPALEGTVRRTNRDLGVGDSHFHGKKCFDAFTLPPPVMQPPFFPPFPLLYRYN
jgi:hypothetical protein